MSTRMTTGISRATDEAGAPDSRRSATEAATRARERFGDGRVDLAVLYCSGDHDFDAVSATVRQVLGGEVPLIGASTAGEFTEERVERGAVAVGLVGSDDMIFFTGLARDIDRDLETAIVNIVRNIPLQTEGYPHRCIFLLTDGLVGNGEEITLMVANMSGPDTIVVGGLAADDFKMRRTVVFSGDQVQERAMAICLMASKKPFVTAMNHGHRPLTGPFRIDRVERNVLSEIGGQTPWDLWRQQTEQEAARQGLDVWQLEQPGETGAFFANFELGLHVGEGRYKVRYPMSKNPDGSVNFTCSIPAGAQACIMSGHDRESQIEASRQAALLARSKGRTLGREQFAGALVVECAVRQLLLGEEFHRAPEAIREVFPGLPILGGECYGELHLEPGTFSGYHNTSTVLLLLPA